MNKVNTTFLRNLETLGDTYIKQYLGKWNKDQLLRDWWHGLDFFFSHSFMRGRKDKLSHEYYTFTKVTLRDYFQMCNGEANIANVPKEQFRLAKNLNWRKPNEELDKIAEENALVRALRTPRQVDIKWACQYTSKRICLENGQDVVMVLDTLNFISKSPDRANIYLYIKHSLERGEIRHIFEELKTIRGVSDKISSFVIRDILLLHPEIELNDPENDYQLAFPVDTHVHRIASMMEEEGKGSLIRTALQEGISPMKLAAGLWYLGFNSLDVALEVLSAHRLTPTSAQKSPTDSRCDPCAD